MTSRLEQRVRKALLARGVCLENIDHAMADGRIELLAIEAKLFAGERRYTIDEVADRSGVPTQMSERLWRALGFASVAPDQAAFREADVKALTGLRKLIEQGMADPEASVQFARVLGSSMARLAEALISLQPGVRLTAEERLAYADSVLRGGHDGVLEATERLIDYTWRRHLQAAARRGMTVERAEDGVVVTGQAVGFADLVGYTALSQQLSEEALARVVSRFEELAYDIVAAAGGRVIKTIGDEVMFAADDPGVAVHIGLALAEAYADDELLSQVRVGLASGQVLAQDGDYFGPVVNLASRLVNVAYPGTVVASQEVFESVRSDPTLAWRSLRRRHLKDIGTVPIWAVHREGDVTPPGVVRRTFQPLRMLLSEASFQRAERKAVEAAVEAVLDAASAGEDAP